MPEKTAEPKPDTYYLDRIKEQTNRLNKANDEANDAYATRRVYISRALLEGADPGQIAKVAKISRLAVSVAAGYRSDKPRRTR